MREVQLADTSCTDFSTHRCPLSNIRYPISDAGEVGSGEGEQVSKIVIPWSGQPQGKGASRSVLSAYSSAEGIATHLVIEVEYHPTPPHATPHPPKKEIAWELVKWILINQMVGNHIRTNFQRLNLGYRKVASRSTSQLVAHPRIFRLFIKGKFDAYVTFHSAL